MGSVWKMTFTQCKFQFTSGVYNQVVEPKREATFEYGFTPSEQFNARPFGLTILLNYKDKVSLRIPVPVFWLFFLFFFFFFFFVGQNGGGVQILKFYCRTYLPLRPDLAR